MPSDSFAQRATNKRVTDAHNELAREAMHLKGEVERFCAEIIKGGPYAGRARNIAHDALDLITAAVAYDSIDDIAEINAAEGG